MICRIHESYKEYQQVGSISYQKVCQKKWQYNFCKLLENDMNKLYARIFLLIPDLFSHFSRTSLRALGLYSDCSNSVRYLRNDSRLVILPLQTDAFYRDLFKVIIYWMIMFKKTNHRREPRLCSFSQSTLIDNSVVCFCTSVYLVCNVWGTVYRHNWNLFHFIFIFKKRKNLSYDSLSSSNA